MLAVGDERGSGRGPARHNLGGDVDTAAPLGSMLFTIMAALAQMEHEITRERVTDSLSNRREAERTSTAGPRRVTDSHTVSRPACPAPRPAPRPGFRRRGG